MSYMKRKDEMMISTEMMSQIMIILAVLVAIVNITTEVIKNTADIKSARFINGMVTFLSTGLTLVVMNAYFEIIEIKPNWYTQVAFGIMGIMVAYGAMFGYDKLLSYFKELRGK